LSLLPGIQRAAQDILRFWHGRLPWPCVRHALSPKRLGYRLRAHCSPRPCARLPLPRSAAEQAGHEGRDHENRGQRPGRQNHPEDHHHECGGRQPSQPAEQTAWRCSFPRWQPTRHHSSPRAAHGTCPIIACGSEFPLPPPAGPPGPDPPPASASKAGTSQHRACQDQYAGQNDPEAMVCLRFTLRTSLPS